MPLNFGKQIQTIPGIQGVATGGQAQVQINPNRRVSRLNFQCAGIAYVAPVASLIVAGTTAAATFTLTVTAGVITGAVITSGTAAGISDGTYPLTITDNITTVDGVINNSYGARITATVATDVVTAVHIVSGGVLSPVPVELFFNGQILQTVGGVNMRDLSATQIKQAAYADDSSEVWPLGELTVYYVKPSMRWITNPDVNIWDLWGQSVLQLQMPISANVSSPQMVGVYEFDADASLRLSVAGPNNTNLPVLQPIAMHSQSFAVPAGSALFSITTVPFLINPTTPLPILRLWMAEQYPGNITQIEIDQDGNKIVQLTQAQIQQMYKDYGFNVNIFGGMFAADLDRRISRALRCQQNLVIWVASAVSQQIAIVRETLPGAYSGG